MSKRTKILQKENNELEKQIQNDSNKSILTDIVVYIRSANINPYYQEKVRRDIWEMIVDGEKRGETAKDIIGDDYKLFCDNVIVEMPKLSRKGYIFSLFRDVLLSIDVLLIIWLVFNLLERESSSAFPYFTVTAGNIICTMLIVIGAFGLFHALSKNTFDIGNSLTKKAFPMLSIPLFVLMLICMCVNAFIQYPLFRIHANRAIGGIIALFVIYKILDMKLD
jgi:DNA-binding ferritin-like protein (Dps family)